MIRQVLGAKQSHLAGTTDLPLQIGTDKRGVIFYCLGSGGWEISKNKIFHLWPCKILQGQISVYYPILFAWVIAHSFMFLGSKTTFYDSTRLFLNMKISYDHENQISKVHAAKKGPKQGISIK